MCFLFKGEFMLSFLMTTLRTFVEISCFCLWLGNGGSHLLPGVYRAMGHPPASPSPPWSLSPLQLHPTLRICCPLCLEEALGLPSAALLALVLSTKGLSSRGLPDSPSHITLPPLQIFCDLLALATTRFCLSVLSIPFLCPIFSS